MKDKIGETIDKIYRVENFEEAKKLQKKYNGQAIREGVLAAVLAASSVLLSYIQENRIVDNVVNKGVFASNDLVGTLLQIGVGVSFAGFGILLALSANKGYYAQIAKLIAEDLEEKGEKEL